MNKETVHEPRIVVGKVFTNNGRLATNAKVKIHHVSGGQRKLAIEKPEAKTDRQGRYCAPFLWKPIEFMDDDLSSSITIRIVAWTEEGDLIKDGYSRDISFTARTIPGYLARDILHPVNMATGNPFSSFPDMVDFVISIG